MTPGNELSYDRAAWRIRLFMAALGAAGTLVAWAVWGPKSGAGFLFGAFISGLNFVFLKGLVDRMGGGRGGRPTVLLALRYPLLAACAYVILKFSKISVSAALAGIFVFTAAVFIEVAFEIAHARK